MDQQVLFEDRFLESFVGSIVTDPAIAIVELVANCWDAYATEVKIGWPNRDLDKMFVIADNGIGMTRREFESRWRTLAYDRSRTQGTRTNPPAELVHLPPRSVFGRYGKGRFASFCFARNYLVTSTKDGNRFTYRVSADITNPFKLELVREELKVSGHGTTITGEDVSDFFRFPVDQAREVIGSRFLADPSFSVEIDGKRITFQDIPTSSLHEEELDFPGLGKVKIVHIDTGKADRTTKQHGIAWWVNRRAVGECKWRGSDFTRILDGRRSEAKRYTFIVNTEIDELEVAVQPDWSWFKQDDPTWNAVYPTVQDKIREMIDRTTQEQRETTRSNVMQRINGVVQTLAPISKDKVRGFVEEVVNNCPSLGEGEITQLSGILAKLENAKSQYGLLSLLHEYEVGDLDQLHEMLSKWTIGMAKLVLDEIETRLKLIQELHTKVQVKGIDEVHELQPIFEKGGLWVFGAEFESIEFTSNTGMTRVVRELLKIADGKGSRNRPDFVALTDESIGFYAVPAYDDLHEEAGVAHLAIIDLKTTTIPIGSTEKEQVWKYVKELRIKGYIQARTRVSGFVLGNSIEVGEEGVRKELDDQVHIRPMLYTTLLARAEKRMLNLYRRVKEAPFMLEHKDEIDRYLDRQAEPQAELLNDLPQGSAAVV